MTARTPDAEPLLTPAEVATMFRVDPKTVTRWQRRASSRRSARSVGTAATAKRRCVSRQTRRPRCEATPRYAP